MKLELNVRDRICFFGDSITAHGIWEAEVVEYFLQHYPELKVEFYNCGISGTKGKNAEEKNRMWCDFLNFFPRYAVIMFGVNDVETILYDKNLETPERIARRRGLLEEYDGTIRRIVDVCKSRGIVPILCTPTPYDEINDFGTDVRTGADGALSYCADVVRKTAEENDIILCDMRKVLVDHIAEKPLREDRTHPTLYGYHLMAEQFLASIGAKDKIEADKVVEISEKNKLRFEIEDILRDLLFVERNYMGWQKEASYAMSYRKRLLGEQIKKEKRDFSQVLKNYNEYADIKDELYGELIRRTAAMYETT